MKSRIFKLLRHVKGNSIYRRIFLNFLTSLSGGHLLRSARVQKLSYFTAAHWHLILIYVADIGVR